MYLSEKLKQVFSLYKNKPALSQFYPPNKFRTLTYRDLLEQTKSFNSFNAKNKSYHYDLNMFFMNKSPELIIAILASIIANKTPSCLNHKLKPSQALSLIEKNKPEFTVIDRYALTILMRSEQKIDPSLTFSYFKCKDDPKAISLLLEKAADKMSLSEYDASLYKTDESFDKKKQDGDAPGFCLFTSGSTGQPKGVLISRDDLYNRVTTEIEDYKLTEKDNLLSLLHYSFDVGLNQLFSSLLSGAHLVILNSWFPKDIFSAIRTAGITGISGVPSIWTDMMFSSDSPPLKEDIKTLRYITVSGGDLSKKQLKNLKTFFNGVGIYKTYGQSEAFRCGILRPDEFNKKITSVGKPPKGVKAFILNSKNQLAAVEEEGEIVHCGTGAMTGYRNDNNETQKKLRKTPHTLKSMTSSDVVVYTGDYGKIDKDGYLYILGRKDGMIKRSGYRLYPKEVEDIILTYKGVKQVAVIGVKDDLIGQKIIAEVVPSTDNLNIEMLTSFLKKVLPTYLLPDSIYIKKSLPMTGTGKINYSRIKEDYE